MLRRRRRAGQDRRHVGRGRAMTTAVAIARTARAALRTMQTAARLWGHCCICGKALIDPVSLERGIGPDCYAHKIDFIRRSAREGWKLESNRRRGRHAARVRQHRTARGGGVVNSRLEQLKQLAAEAARKAAMPRVAATVSINGETRAEA
jgi:Family of unknown function (DUF6011)